SGTGASSNSNAHQGASRPRFSTRLAVSHCSRSTGCLRNSRHWLGEQIQARALGQGLLDLYTGRSQASIFNEAGRAASEEVKAAYVGGLPAGGSLTGQRTPKRGAYHSDAPRSRAEQLVLHLHRPDPNVGFFNRQELLRQTCPTLANDGPEADV